MSEYTIAELVALERVEGALKARLAAAKAVDGALREVVTKNWLTEDFQARVAKALGEASFRRHLIASRRSTQEIQDGVRVLDPTHAEPRRQAVDQAVATVAGLLGKDGPIETRWDLVKDALVEAKDQLVALAALNEHSDL